MVSLLFLYLIISFFYSFSGIFWLFLFLFYLSFDLPVPSIKFPFLSPLPSCPTFGCPSSSALDPGSPFAIRPSTRLSAYRLIVTAGGDRRRQVPVLLSNGTLDGSTAGEEERQGGIDE